MAPEHRVATDSARATMDVTWISKARINAKCLARQNYARIPNPYRWLLLRGSGRRRTLAANIV